MSVVVTAKKAVANWQAPETDKPQKVVAQPDTNVAPTNDVTNDADNAQADNAEADADNVDAEAKPTKKKK